MYFFILKLFKGNKNTNNVNKNGIKTIGLYHIILGGKVIFLNFKTKVSKLNFESIHSK